MLLFFTIITLVSAFISSSQKREGTMQFSRIDSKFPYDKLRIYGNNLYLSNKRSIFDYHQGTLELSKRELYLSVGNDGRLITGYTPHYGFSLESISGSSWSVLSYKGISQFQICGDTSISFNGSCAQSSVGRILFEDRVKEGRSRNETNLG